jgi:hypothetical protein
MRQPQQQAFRHLLIGLALTLAAALPWAPVQASVLFIDGGTISGLPGDSISLLLADNDVIDLEAADLQLVYDPTVLQLTDVRNGSLTSGFSIAFSQTPLARADGLVDVFISLITGGSAVSGSGSLLELLFDIQLQARSGTSLDVVLPSFADPAAYTFQRFSTPVDVRRPIALPEVGSAPLVVIALLALFVLTASPRRSHGRVF